jgi:hypothetical protein
MSGKRLGGHVGVQRKLARAAIARCLPVQAAPIRRAMKHRGTECSKRRGKLDLHVCLVTLHVRRQLTATARIEIEKQVPRCLGHHHGTQAQLLGAYAGVELQQFGPGDASEEAVAVLDAVERPRIRQSEQADRNLGGEDCRFVGVVGRTKARQVQAVAC